MNDLYSLLSTFAWLEEHSPDVDMQQTPKKTHFVTILWGDDIENETYN